MGKPVYLQIGQKFNKWTVLCESKRQRGSRTYRCQCDCGTIQDVKVKDLRYGSTKSCGCLLNLVGQRFGKLVVIKEQERGHRKNRYWLCRCDCGNKRTINQISLCAGYTKSCGCLSSRHSIGVRSKTHGKTKTPEYRIWSSMKQRCTDKNYSGYYKYGARGIQIDPNWKSFERFYEDMGNRPSPKHSIERKNNNGHYCKENCRWATAKEQANNTRRSRIIVINSQSKTLAQWSEICHISSSTLRNRIERGMEAKYAIETLPKKAKILRLGNKSQPINLWSKELNIALTTLYSRLLLGWSVRKTLTTPLRFKNN